MIWNTELYKARLICVSSRFQSEGGTLPSGRWSRNSLHPLPAPRPRCLKAARQPQVREAWHIVVVESLELTWPRTLGKKVFKRILLLFVLIYWFRVSLPSKCQGPISHSNFQHNAESMRSQLEKKKAPKTGLVNHLHPFSRSLWEMWVLYYLSQTSQPVHHHAPPLILGDPRLAAKLHCFTVDSISIQMFQSNFAPISSAFSFTDCMTFWKRSKLATPSWMVRIWWRFTQQKCCFLRITWWS